MKNQYDVVIVGGGHNALVAACYLAQAGKSVVVLEKNSEFGGATTSVNAFPGVPARLSRYSYLVALLPDKIKQDLNLEFETLSRQVSSYTPWRESGVLINRLFDQESRDSIDAIASQGNNDHESQSWERFYSRIAQVAKVLAPTMLQPLVDESQIRELVGPELWQEFIETPLDVTLEQYFSSDVIKGIVLTDGLIGTFASARDHLANICFIYHLIGNGTGEWRVPRGGMGALVEALLGRARALGVELRAQTSVLKVESSDSGITATDATGVIWRSKLLLAACSPKSLERISGIAAPSSQEGSQIKMNMVLQRLPRLKSGIDPRIAFAGTFHIDESYTQLERAYEQARDGQIPDEIPSEIYCHTLTDDSILGESLRKSGAQTLTLFALHTPASLFDVDHDKVKAEVGKRILRGLNNYLAEPVEDLLLKDENGKPCIEIKTPQELEKEIDLPRGNIFHGDLTFPWRSKGDRRKWGVETADPRVLVAGAGALRGGGVSGIAGHNAAMAALEILQ